MILFMFLSSIVLLTSILPFLPSAASITSARSFSEQFIPLYKNVGFEEAVGNNVVGWNLINGSKISRTIAFEGGCALNLTPSKPFTVPQAIYVGKNASSRYIVGGNLVLALAAKASNKIVQSLPSYLVVQNIVLHVGPTNVTAFLFNLILYRDLGNLSDGITFTDYGVVLCRRLERSEDWVEYALQMSSLREWFAEYLVTRRGVEAEAGDEYDVVGLTVWSENLAVYVDNLSLYMMEPKWLILTISSNSIIPMSSFISEIRVNGTVPYTYYVEPNIVLPFSPFNLWVYIPYIPLNNSVNIVSIKFSTGQALSYRFVETTRRVWIRI